MGSRQRLVGRLAADRQASTGWPCLGLGLPCLGKEGLHHEPCARERAGRHEPELPITHGKAHHDATSRYATAPATHASELIQPSCSSAQRQPPASRAVSTSVGKHCIAST